MSAKNLLPWSVAAASLSVNAWLLTGPAAPPAPTSPAVTLQAPRVPAVPIPVDPAATDAPAAESPAAEPAIDPAAEAAIAAAQRKALLSADAAAEARAFAHYAGIVARQLDTPDQQADLQRVLGRWIATDPIGASAWLNEQPASRGLDLAVAQVARFLVTAAKWEQAAEWAASIDDPAVRAEAFDEIYAEGFRSNRFDAAAVRNSGLPPEKIAAILNGSRLD